MKYSIIHFAIFALCLSFSDICFVNDKCHNMAAAVGIKESNGSCYYKTDTFDKYKLISGEFRSLAFTQASDKVGIPTDS